MNGELAVAGFNPDVSNLLKLDAEDPIAPLQILENC